MQFFQTIAVCASALAAFAAAQSTEVAIYNMPDTVTVGKATTLQINPGSGAYTLTLRKGNPMDLQNISTITTTGQGKSYSWTPDANLADGSDYAIMISQGDQSNYTPEFTITGGKAAGSGSSPGSYGGGSSSSSAASTLSTAAKTGSASGCAVTQIKDGQPQAPASCSSSSSAAAATSTPSYASNSTASSAPAGGYAPYNPLPGATGSPASNSTSSAPTYTVPSPTANSGSGSSYGGSQSSASAPKQTGGAAQIGSSFALIAGAVAAFAFLN